MNYAHFRKSGHISRCREVVTALSDCLKCNNTLQVLGISWNDNDIKYVYTVGINNKCCVNNVWSKNYNALQHCVSEYNYEESVHWQQCLRWSELFDHRSVLESDHWSVLESDHWSVLESDDWSLFESDHWSEFDHRRGGIETRLR